MKKVLLVLMAFLLFVSMCACSKESEQSSNTENSSPVSELEDESVAMRESCWAKVTDYKVVEQEDGMATVTLTAPDYPALLQHLVDNGVTTGVTIDMLDEAAAQNPDAVKEYSFAVDAVNEEDVKEALMEQIAFDLMAVAVGGMMG